MSSETASGTLGSDSGLDSSLRFDKKLELVAFVEVSVEKNLDVVGSENVHKRLRGDSSLKTIIPEKSGVRQEAQVRRGLPQARSFGRRLS